MTFLQIFENRIPFPSPLNLFTRLNLPSFSPVFCTVIHRKGTDCPFLKLFWLLCILLQVFFSLLLWVAQNITDKAFPDSKSKQNEVSALWEDMRCPKGLARGCQPFSWSHVLLVLWTPCSVQLFPPHSAHGTALSAEGWPCPRRQNL